MSRRRVAVLMLAASSASATYAQNAVFSTVATNSCAVGINNLTTSGDYQFIGYYNTAGNVMIGRRELGSASWQTFNSGLTATAAQMADDHNVIAIAVDSAGYMHTSWNMHN